MLQRLLAATLTLALAATGAAAYVSPAAKPGGSLALVVPVVDPPVQKKVVPKRPVSVQRNVIVPKRQAVVVKRAPVAVKKAPVISKAPIVANKQVPFVKGKGVSKMPVQFVHVRQHRRHKWYGRAIGGVVLGTIIAGSAFYAYSQPPADGLCWYWTSSARERGYWDYCTPPDDED